MIIGSRIQGKCRVALLNPHHVQLSTRRVVVQERGLEPLASRSQAARSTNLATPGCLLAYGLEIIASKVPCVKEISKVSAMK